MNDQPPEQAQQQDGSKWTWQFTVAVVLLVGFAALVVVMLMLADAPDDKIWQRRVYLFGAMEAVVFTAVGWLFGREVHRSAAETATQVATEAKEDAATARGEAKQKADEAAKAEQKAAEERARAETVASVIEHSESGLAAASPGVSRDAGIGGAAARPTGTVVDLKALVRDLYGR